MTTAGQPQLLSIDEACNLIGSSAIALVDAIGEPSERLPYLLSGRGTLRGLSAPAATAARPIGPLFATYEASALVG